ncbi:hypothetical protein AB0K60_07080 [Thermopolyspora sp. NPDC052614]|uniref:hypothetical protein n=1 Tax=Thermopolyspora sp. NPDC052614 TaxID=3155682 RepID=UPI00343C0CCB
MTGRREISEAEAIGTLLARLPDADAGVLLELGRTCPDETARKTAARIDAALRRLRTHLADLIDDAHRQAIAAEEWIASLETPTDSGA